MRVIAITLLTIMLMAGSLAAEGPGREDCAVCGMWIDQNMHTRLVIETSDHSTLKFCSFACVSKYVSEHASGAVDIKVADYLSADLTDAKTAYYVIGSDAPPVMSSISTVAFASRSGALEFIKLHKGKLTTFDAALKANAR